MYCNGSYSCGSAVVYGNNCSTVFVELDTGNNVGRKLQVYAPGNNGNLTVTTNVNGGDNTGTECEEMDIYCPYYYNYQNINDESKPCQINCINTTQCIMDIFTNAGNWRKDIDFNCRNCDLTTNTVNVYCNYLTTTSELCTIKNDTSQFMDIVKLVPH